MLSVFIVDDSSLFRRELMETMPWTELGCRVVGQADNGETAENLIRKMRPDIVITDICMPCRGGLDMIEALADLSGIEFIIVSAYSKFEYAMRAIKLQAHDYLLKPIHDEELIATLRKVIDRIQKRDAAKIPEETINPDTLYSHVEKLVQYIQEHYAQNLQISHVAKALFISESYVSKICRRELNTTFSEYVQYIRVQKSLELLKQPSARIYEVAEWTGFKDYKYFCTVFKKFTGITPKQYHLSWKMKE